MTDRPRFDPRELVAQGWQRRNVAAEPRLGEAVALYRSLGYEVLLVPMADECAADGGEGTCTTCFGADEDPGRYQVIYTRPGLGAGDDEGTPG